MTQQDQWISTAVQAALAAGKAILEVYDTPFEVETKEDYSPLTEADKRAHAVIAKALDPTGLPLLSEEGKQTPFAERNGWDRFWMVDPLDGTKEFVKRNGEFTVNIALIEQGYPVAGVIYVPVKGWLYVANGAQAYKLESATDVLDWEAVAQTGQALPKPKADAVFRVVGSRSHMSPETEAFIKEQEQAHEQVEIVSMGSSLKLCLVAEGAADVYPRFAPTMEWDTAAGQAIAEAAGRSVTNHPAGDRMRYNKSDLLNPWFIVS